MTEQLDIETWEPKGATIVPSLDTDRLRTQYRAVRGLMIDGHWRTLREISDALKAPEASVSARLRDLRKNGYDVQRQRRGDPKKGLHEYRVVAKE